MKSNKFLSKVRKEKKIELVDASEEVCESYLEKSANCLRSAKILAQNSLYENAIGQAYYSMYDAVVALLFRVGIKCENHAASILLLKLLFDKKNLFEMISKAKKERIDKQHYVSAENDNITKESAKELIADAEDFILKMKLAIKSIDEETISDSRINFASLTD